jgi:hypothetical protein
MMIAWLSRASADSRSRPFTVRSSTRFPSVPLAGQLVPLIKVSGAARQHGDMPPQYAPWSGLQSQHRLPLV